MKRVYLAAPLFDDMELQRNLEVCNKLEEIGLEVFLPQRDAGEAFEGVDRFELFSNDVSGVIAADIVVALLDGRVPDEGTVFEVGLAYGKRIPVIALKTDRRSFMEGHMNVMLEYGVSKTFNNISDLVSFMEEWSK